MKEIIYPTLKTQIKIDENGKINYFIETKKNNFLDKIDKITNLKFTNLFLNEIYSEIKNELLLIKPTIKNIGIINTIRLVQT